MKNKLKLIFIILISFFLVDVKNVKAYSSNDYKGRNLCGNYELAGFHKDGFIDKVSCHNSYADAKNEMIKLGADDLAIMTKVNGNTKIIDANLGLLDLTGNPELTYYYLDSETNGGRYTYMNNGSKYGGVDGAHIETHYSSQHGWNVKTKIAGFTGWIRQNDYEIVPITWVKSASYYNITNESITHKYASKIQESYMNGSGSEIGPKPIMIEPGNYYSYDGHYFYKDLKNMIKDYKNDNFNNAVNKDKEYYNYYMYLSNHTKTSYSSINIDEYIRDNMGLYRETYGIKAGTGASKLYGMGTFFYHAQEKYGVNAILSLSLSRNETGNGRSNLAINKNNGFGLNAVDSNPGQAANWYATFASSILGYANKWITYGYADPFDWRYFGPQFGNKSIGMNVKYASDTYWSEKMARNYYSLDKAKGMQDYDFYQLGVTTKGTVARDKPSNNSKEFYRYSEPENSVVIIDEVEGTNVEGNNKWYKIVSDVNLDINRNKLTYGEYNWDSFVYVPAAHIKKINTGKNGYISPKEITEYADKHYTYDLNVENAEFKPEIGISLSETSYNYDPTLTSKTGAKLQKDRYVIIYATAFNEKKEEVSYLVTSDYWYSQKHWVDANQIRKISGEYGKVIVDHPSGGNYYSWVNYNTEDVESTKISGLYTYAVVPILEKRKIGSNEWYKVPVNLKGNSNQIGWTLRTAPKDGIIINTYNTIVKNNLPVINVSDKEIKQGSIFDPKKDVSAKDYEDGDLTSQIKVIKNEVKKDIPGEYKVIYQVTDKNKETVTKEITVKVIQNMVPVISANDFEILEGRNYNEKKNVTATDEEDGNLTNKITIKENTVNINKPGKYKIVYQVTDSYNQIAYKTITVTVLDDENPIILASDKEIKQYSKVNYKENIKATDKEDGDLTNKIVIEKNDVNIDIIGNYEIIYSVTDSIKQKTQKSIKVKVVENKKPTIIANDITIKVGEKIDLLKYAKAYDEKNNDITDKIKIETSNLNINIPGKYKVIYKVKDSLNLETTKEIIVTVEENKLVLKDGEFYLHSLLWNEKEKKYEISGYLIILNENNLDKNPKYTMILESKQNNNKHEKDIKPWLDDVPYSLGKENNNDYTISWFKDTIDLENIPNGDYNLYMKTIKDNNYSIEEITNIFNIPIKRRKEHNNINYNFKVQLSLKSQKIELSVRHDKAITESEAPTFRNMINNYDNIRFINNKLNIIGTSYNYDGTYDNPKEINRELILENINDFKQYKYDIGSTNKGSYKVTSVDNKSKEYAWYNANIDISKIPVGRYSMIVHTKTKNADDYGEITDIFGSINKAEIVIQNKIFRISLNEERMNRIELIVDNK